MNRIFSLVMVWVMVFSCVCAAAEAGEWTCPDCGAVMATNFCTQCGARKLEKIVCADCGTEYPADSGVAFCGNCGAKLRQGVRRIRYEGDGFATPEEALTCYMEGLKNLDFEQILSAFAWETQMEHYSVLTVLERVRSYSPLIIPRMPSLNDFMFSANLNMLRYSQINSIYRSIEEYILADDSLSYTNTGTIGFQKDSDDAADFLKKFDNGRLEKLSQMTNIRFLPPDAVTENKFSNEQNQVAFTAQTACYGADETVNIVGVADVGDELFYCCPTICRYGDKWYLVSVGSSTSNFMSLASVYQAFCCGLDDLEQIIH